MAGTTSFRTDPLLIKVLSENYRSTEKAAKELVDNAWDADAEEVRITLPAPMSGDPIVIEDNGMGMTPSEVEGEYMIVADDRRSRRGVQTDRLKRQVKGKKGIGKFAGLMAADIMEVKTKAQGKCTQVRIHKEALRPRAGALDAVPLPMDVDDCPPAEHGTTITLSCLNQAFEYPSADKLRRLLFLEYGRTENFVIYVNGTRLALGDLPGVFHEHKADLPHVGPVALRFTIGEGKHGFRDYGIVIRVQGKTVGEPVYFGLDQDKLVTLHLLKQVYGEVEADGLIEGVTADWGAIIENSAGYSALKEWVAEKVKTALRAVHKRETKAAEARVQRQIDAALAKLPEHRRPTARRYIKRVLEKLYKDPPEKIEAIVELCLEALENDDYYTVVAQLEKAAKSDVVTFASALKDFGLADMSFMLRQAMRRMEVLDYMDSLLINPETTEKELHVSLEGNLWILGPEYEVLSSNRTVAGFLDDHLGVKFTGPRANKRPDLFLGQTRTNGYLLIEFKRPAKTIDRDDQNQAIKYRDDLIKRCQPISILMLGKGPAASVDPRDEARDLTVVSYTSLISTARTRLEWLLRELADHRLPQVPEEAATA